MPSRDGSGKRLSGSAQRQRTTIQRGAYEQAQQAIGDTVPTLDGLTVPPPEDTSQLVTWAAKQIGLVMWQALNDKALKGLDRYRLIGQLGAQIGMLRDKATEQEKLDKLARKHGLIKNTTGLAEGMKPLAGIVKPPTARGYRPPPEIDTKSVLDVPRGPT